MKDFRQLKVWEKSHQLALAVYKVTKSFPKEELYGLTTQIRRASMSIPTNIAEGCGRNTDADFARFLQIAMGSASETEYQLILAYDLEFLSKESYDELHSNVEEVKRMLASFLKTLRELTADG
ncbi:MAG TPA: diversity-generating retroelement protein bAvd family protein [Anaerolineae bacterium]|nr:diversity-generating retroelement protein bAvd family protein [Anaerolineae bacterium]